MNRLQASTKAAKGFKMGGEGTYIFIRIKESFHGFPEDLPVILAGAARIAVNPHVRPVPAMVFRCYLLRVGFFRQDIGNRKSAIQSKTKNQGD